MVDNKQFNELPPEETPTKEPATFDASGEGVPPVDFQEDIPVASEQGTPWYSPSPVTAESIAEDNKPKLARSRGANDTNAKSDPEWDRQHPIVDQGPNPRPYGLNDTEDNR